jgi:MFS family permease
MIFAVSMTFIDQTIVSIAVPQIQRELGPTSTGVLWVVNAYLLSLAALFAFGSRLADTVQQPTGDEAPAVAGAAEDTEAAALAGPLSGRPRRAAAAAVSRRPGWRRPSRRGRTGRGCRPARPAQPGRAGPRVARSPE